MEAIFLKSVATEKDCHTSKYIVDSLNKVITEISPSGYYYGNN